MPDFTTTLTSFNNYPKQICTLHRPERYRELLQLNKPLIARGQGCSYGDAALNQDGHVMLTERLNRFVAFDQGNGLLTVEAGITLAEIAALIFPRGWCLAVTPGTQQVTVGGCIAADIHGKNHPTAQSFASYVDWLDLIIADGKIIRCSATENSNVFWATVGGMGLTGIIAQACLRLTPLPTPYVKVNYQPTLDLADTIQQLQNNSHLAEHNVAWLDTLAAEKNFGRGIVMSACALATTDLPTNLPHKFKHTTARFTVPMHTPHWILNKTTLKFFNRYYYERQSKKKSCIVNHADFFYPLDSVRHWHRLYGKRGFIQYQCVFPLNQALSGITHLLQYLRASIHAPFLTVLKQLGAANHGFLSFPQPGLTLALDLPINDTKLFTVLDQLDAIVVAHQGRIYLAKDARTTPAMFRLMYPRYQEWLAIKNQLDPDHIFSSSLSRRLELC